MSQQSNPNQPNSVSPDLKELLSSNVSPEERTKGLFFLNLKQTKTTDPQLADIMLECAIPRRLDATTIGILRDAPEDTETNDHLFSRLKLFSFVQLRSDGYYVYHDNTRDVILKVWESDDYREKFNKLKEKLAHFYKIQYQEHRSRRELDASIEDMHSVIEVQPENGVNYFLRGVLYYELQDYTTALTDFNKAIELRPEDGNNYAWRGIVHYELKDYPAALTDFNKAIELRPEDPSIYAWRGHVHYELKNKSAALMDFSKAIELRPEDGLNYYWRGRLIHRESKDYPAALTDFNKAIELRPEDPSIYAWRGRVHYELKNKSAALMDFSKAIELRPEDGVSYYWRGVIYYGMKDYQAASSDFREAVTYLSQIIAEFPGVDGNYYWRALTYFELKNYSAALADLNTSIKLAGNAPSDYYWRGRVHYELKDYPAALADFSRAIELRPQESLISFFEEIVPHYHFEVYTDAILEFEKMFHHKQKNR
jgi:tetratricopeptide (TPR) repeat protein